MDYQHMGMAALIPGMQFMIDSMQKQLDDLRKTLSGLQQADAEPASNLDEYLFKRKSKTSKGYWAKMNAEERSAEMRRRAILAFKKKKRAQAADEDVDVNALHPRDRRSPQHKKWAKSIKSAQRRFWDNLSDQERRDRIDHMLAARAHNKGAQYMNGRAQ